jgi:hypothetical protein
MSWKLGPRGTTRTPNWGYANRTRQRRRKMLDFGSINWIAVVVGVIASNVLGFLW